MIEHDIAELIDHQFEIFRQMLVRKETFMLRKDYKHREAFIRGSFKNLKNGLAILHETVKANYR